MYNNNIRDNSLTSNVLFYSTLLGEKTLYAVQQTELPSIDIDHPRIANRSGIFNMQGDVAEYQPIVISFLVDSRLERWKELIKVFQTYHTPGSSECTVLRGTSWIEVRNNNNDYLFKVVLHESYFKSISSLRYASNEEDDVLSVEVTVVYDYFTIE
jgi:hypothetical protein